MNKHAQRPKVHEVKCDPESFVLTRKGRKPFELRQDERDYQAGDYLLLREFVDGEYTGDTVMTVIQSTLRHGDRYGDMLAPGCIVMGILPYRRPRSI